MNHRGAQLRFALWNIVSSVCDMRDPALKSAVPDINLIAARDIEYFSSITNPKVHTFFGARHGSAPMLDSPILLAAAIGSAVAVLIYALVQRYSKPSNEPPRDTRDRKRHEPRPPPNRRP